MYELVLNIKLLMSDTMNENLINPDSIDLDSILNAIKEGDLKYIENSIQKFTIDKTYYYYCFYAILINNIEVFNWLKKENFLIDINNKDDKWDQIRTIITDYDLDTIIRLYKYGYSFEEYKSGSGYTMKEIDGGLDYYDSGYYSQEDNIDEFDILRWSHKNKCSFGDLDMLKWAYENGYPWNEQTSANIASEGNLDMFKWAHEKGCPWDEQTSRRIAINGNFDMLKWAHEKGCPWDKQTSANIASEGNFDMLKWAHENGCPWDEETCANIAINGNLDMLKWAHENGCPWDHYTYYKAQNKDMINWLETQNTEFLKLKEFKNLPNLCYHCHSSKCHGCGACKCGDTFNGPISCKCSPERKLGIYDDLINPYDEDPYYIYDEIEIERERERVLWEEYEEDEKFKWQD